MTREQTKYIILSRTEVRYVYCPACKAQPGHYCIHRNGKPRISNHREREQLARRMFA